jgi:hypothetical protein
VDHPAARQKHRRRPYRYARFCAATWQDYSRPASVFCLITRIAIPQKEEFGSDSPRSPFST